MPAYFPEPYEDELLYSVLARYHRHMGSNSPKQTLDDLFGSRTVAAGLDIQGHLGSLSAHLPPAWGLTPERLATDFTLLPYYLAFQSDEVRERARQAVTAGSISGLHFLLGLAQANSRVRNLRFCSDCQKEMDKNHGELYWRRSHQLPGVLLCLQHGRILKETTVPPRLGNRHAFIAATHENCSFGRLVAPTSLAKHEALQAITHACGEALRTPPLARGHDDWAAWYRSRLFLAGFAPVGGHVRQESLERAIRHHFGEALAPLLAEAGVSDLSWLPRLTWKRRRALHPIFHILLQEFLLHLEADQPFGLGPWPCLNPLSSHQGAPLISKVGIHRNHGRIVGVFECECGFAYTQNVAPDSGNVSRPRPLRFGEYFDQKLRQLVESHIGIRETARQLHVDAGTVRLHAAKLGLYTDWKPILPPVTIAPDHGAHRESWNALMKKHSAAGRKYLASLAPALHRWLYRHDKEWLKAHQPAARKSPNLARHDWARLDQEWMEGVAQIADTIRNEQPPRKVTLAEISRRTKDPTWLPSHLKHLPGTRACLEQLRDTVTSFQVRRIAWAARQLVASGLPLIEWRIRRMAGLGKFLTPQVAVAMSDVLSSTASSREAILS